jgi:putative oxidoreductase
MERWLRPYEGPILSIARIVVGFLFWCHGAQKLLGLFPGGPPEMNGILWLAGLIEFFGGGLVALGLFTGSAAFVCSGQMAFAYFMAHQPQGLFPIVNRGELAVLYCFFFLALAARGGGQWSLDAMRRS